MLGFFLTCFLVHDFFSSSVSSARILTLTLTHGHCPTTNPPQKVNGPSLMIRCKDVTLSPYTVKKKLPTQEFIMASFLSIQITEGDHEWTSAKYWDVLSVKVDTFFTDNPALLADYISNLQTRPDDVFVVSYPKSGWCFL